MDTLGAIVRAVKADGRLPDRIGGLNMISQSTANTGKTHSGTILGPSDFATPKGWNCRAVYIMEVRLMKAINEKETRALGD